MTRKFSFDDVIRGLPPDSVQLVEALVGWRRQGGGPLHLVGGPVRDLLLKRPVRDVDLLVEGDELGDAESLARKAAPAGARIVAHDRFGTVRIDWGGSAVDLATARREVYTRPGALPRVEVASLEEDLCRRDFTVNSLAIPLLPNAPGDRVSVIDPGTGLEDLAAGQLCVFHGRSFHDDPTRAIRAARLSTLLGFALARRSASQLRVALRDGAFASVSGDRLRREVRMLFADASRGLDLVQALRRLEGWGVLSVLEPGLALPRDAVGPLRRLRRLAAGPPWPGPRARLWVAGFCIWLAPMPPELRHRALQRFSVRGDVAERIAGFSKLRDASLATLGRSRGRGAVDRVLGEFDEERLLALCASATPPVGRRIERWAAEDRRRRSPVGGNELLEIGISGAAVGR
ncbi:MAG: hypothetical protein VCB42_11415, partial [Myxococcota bacterium]